MSAQTEQAVTMRYLTDPEFHARVATAVALTEFTMKRATGMDPTPDFRAGFVQACAYGLFMADVPVEQLHVSLEQVEASMRATAEMMGFTLGKQPVDGD